MNGPPVFIVGNPRSGTTLLASLLGRHPEVAVPPETSFLLPFRQWSVRRHWNNPSPPATSECARMLSELELDAESVQTRLREVGGAGPRDFFDAVLASYAARRGKPRWAEKTPHHLRRLRTLFAWYPDARVICSIRDGRDAAPSAMRLPGPPRSIIWHSQNWNRSIDTCLRWQDRRPSQVKLVRFEDLLTEPEPVLRSVCEFCALDYDEQQLNHEINSGVRLQHETWKEKIDGPIDPSRAYAWRKSDDAEGVSAMTCVMGRRLATLGYPDPRGEGLSAWRRAQVKLWSTGVFVSRVPTGVAYRLGRYLRS